MLSHASCDVKRKYKLTHNPSQVLIIKKYWVTYLEWLQLLELIISLGLLILLQHPWEELLQRLRITQKNLYHQLICVESI